MLADVLNIVLHQPLFLNVIFFSLLHADQRAPIVQEFPWQEMGGQHETGIH